jgi:hypothetical protein
MPMSQRKMTTCTDFYLSGFNRPANTVARTDDEKFEALLEYAVTTTLKDEPLDDEQPEGEDFDRETHTKLRKEHLKMMTRRHLRGDPHMKSKHDEDDFIAVDVHGNFDLDYDNFSPVLNKGSQWTSMGHTALKNVDNINAIKKKEAHLNKALLPGSKNAHGKDSEDQGYESSSSEVSQDHCRISPYYPPCDSSCWLRAVQDLPKSEQHSLPAVESLATATDIYEHLNAGETRVLILQPGFGMEPIVCRLEKMKIPGVVADSVGSKSLEKDFEALSYTWGSPSRTHIITCNRKSFPVTTNLFHALTYLRYPNQVRTIWVDALCINQEDVAERNEQVRYMLDIYKAAVRVVVWLGLPGNDGGFVLAAMNFLNFRENRRTIMQKDHDPACLVRLKSLITSLDIFFGRPWFSRCWIRQEVSAAKTIIVQCGLHQTTWNAMKKTANCIWRLREKLRCQNLQLDSPRENDTALETDVTQRGKEKNLPLRYLRRHWVLGQSLQAELGDIRSVWYYHTGGILDLLMVSRLFDATNPRDKVYSVLGLAQIPIAKSSDRAAPFDPEAVADTATSCGMLVDYSATVSETYQYIAKYLINRDRNLDILCILSTHQDQDSADLPTWTPDWRVPVSSVSLMENLEYFTYKWGAAGFSKCLLQDQKDHGRLVVEGFPVAQVTQLLPLTPTSIPHPPEMPAGEAVLFDPTVHVRRFAMTDKKAGVVPGSAIEGDLIFVLFGCKMPITLRLVEISEEGLTAMVVGPCYVPTIMYGEAMKDFLEDESAKKMKIVLI